MYKNKEDYQAYQERWRSEHPNYFKEYYKKHNIENLRFWNLFGRLLSNYLKKFKGGKK
jgi:hypothetical protein